MFPGFTLTVAQCVSWFTAMAEKRTVYLSEQALALVRPGESLSGRLNAIVERYALLLQLAPYVRIEPDDTGQDAMKDCADFLGALKD